VLSTVPTSTLRVIWFRSANSHTGPQPSRCTKRPDRWQHPTTCRPPKKPLASSGGVHRWKADAGLCNSACMLDRTLATDIRSAALLQGQFRLRSGQVSSTYFDKYRFEADPVLLKRVAAEMIPLLPKGTQVLAGLELGGVPIATAISLATGIPTAFVRKKAKDYGTCLAVEGGNIRGRRVVLIEDVITTGGAVAEAAGWSARLARTSLALFALSGAETARQSWSRCLSFL
jgi:orotate phosphoribosyltransferase